MPAHFFTFEALRSTMNAVCSFFCRLFKWTPGPVLAKFTRLWATSHHADGSYADTVQHLHLRHGSLVQVGPSVFSVSDQDHFEGLSKLEAGSYTTQPSAALFLRRRVMSNIFRNEHLIDACNEELFAFFTNSAENNTSVNIPNLIARYAYEVMIATTTGQLAGFLDITPNQAKVDRTLEEWRFYAVLYGSYLRYHPHIAKIRKLCGLDRISQDQRFAMTPEELMPDSNDQSCSASNGTKTPPANLEARIALSLAGADPVITLILKLMHRMYTETGLLSKLREEISAAGLTFPISFQQLIERKDRLPLMIGVLLDCLPIQAESDTRTYTSPEGGYFVGNTKVPQGATIILEPTPIPHINPTTLGDDSAWNPDKWLDSSLAPNMKHDLLAHNLTNIDGNSIKMFQILLGLKTCAQMAMSITLLEAVELPWTVSVSVIMADAKKKRDEEAISLKKTLAAPHLRYSSSGRSLSSTLRPVSAPVVASLPISPSSAEEFIFSLPAKIPVSLPPVSSPFLSADPASVTHRMPSVPAPVAETVTASRGARGARGARSRRPAPPPRMADSRLQRLQATQQTNPWLSFGNAATQQATSEACVGYEERKKDQIVAQENAAPTSPVAPTFTESWAPPKPNKKTPEWMKNAPGPAAPTTDPETKATEAKTLPPHLRAAAKAKAAKEEAAAGKDQETKE